MSEPLLLTEFYDSGLCLCSMMEPVVKMFIQLVMCVIDEECVRCTRLVVLYWYEYVQLQILLDVCHR